MDNPKRIETTHTLTALHIANKTKLTWSQRKKQRNESHPEIQLEAKLRHLLFIVGMQWYLSRLTSLTHKNFTSY